MNKLPRERLVRGKKKAHLLSSIVATDPSHLMLRVGILEEISPRAYSFSEWAYPDEPRLAVESRPNLFHGQRSVIVVYHSVSSLSTFLTHSLSLVFRLSSFFAPLFG